MEKEQIKKIVISSIVFLILLGGLLSILLIELGIQNIIPVNSIFEQKDKLNQAEADLIAIENSYDNSISSVENAKKSFNTQKQKYDSISDETIQIIKDAYTTQDYSIEYMWIKLGNYAQKNRLSLVMIEPGGNDALFADTSTDVDSSSTSTPTANTVSALRIKVLGSYLDISNFIFQLESDTELKFRLDNITMELISGTTISATFDVKNIVISK